MIITNINLEDKSEISENISIINIKHTNKRCKWKD